MSTAPLALLVLPLETEHISPGATSTAVVVSLLISLVSEVVKQISKMSAFLIMA